MQFLFDHIISIMVSGVVLLIFVYIQMRGSSAATEATINHMVYSEALQLNEFLERDLENMLTQIQTQLAIDGGNYTGSASFVCQLSTAGGYTTTLTFPTIAHADSSITFVGDPNDAEAVEVTYQLVATMDSIAIPVGNVIQNVPLFELRREVGGKIIGISLPYVTAFEVQFGAKGSNTFLPASALPTATTACSADLSKVRFEFQLAAEGIGFVTNDQRSTSQQNLVRFGSTVTLSNWE
ncbi:MAG: hypothetical protein AAF564_01365 [Bacteroidota bacterium]